MKLVKLAFGLGGAGIVVMAGATSLTACSSSSSSGTSGDSGTTAQDSGMAASDDSGPIADSGTTSETSTASDSGSAGDGNCEKPPKLFPETTPGIYCPFSAVDGGSDITCAAGQHCCEVPSGSSSPSTCVALGTACPVANSVDWQCEAPIDCTVTGSAGPICCGTGSPTTATHCGVTWPEWTGFTGTVCAASCPAPGITVCETQGDCGDAGTCTASKSNGNDFGFCGP